MNAIDVGGVDVSLSDGRVAELLDGLLAQLADRNPLRRVLLIPPDGTRLHSGAGPITVHLYQRLRESAEVIILPALGTHAPMTATERERMFPGIPASAFRDHDWRRDVVPLGEISADRIAELSSGRVRFSARVEVNRLLVERPWDAILSIGQLVPHEVIGIANQAKNIFVGVGGSDLINKTHWLGAVVGIERILGRAETPVRAIFDEAAERLAAHLPITYVLTVRARDRDGKLVTRGLFAGPGKAGFRRGAPLCRAVNLDVLPRAPRKMVVFLDPEEFKSTWLGNKAIYRTRMAIADGGELVVLAPGVREFGEDPTIDRLIRRFGYRGTLATLAGVGADPELAANLSAPAHLIHGSTEGRFSVTYAPGRLSRADIEGVGYRWGDLATLIDHYQPARLEEGWNALPDGEEIFFISNPALGLWCTADRMRGVA